MIQIQAPAPLQWPEQQSSVFLAGSIDEGRAEHWQQEVATALSNEKIVLLNPRRDDWGKGWTAEWQDAHFREQVQWELEALERADWIFYYFAPQSQAPITLLELGLHAQSGRCLVCCPPTFWRSGNVRAVCDRYQVPHFTDLDSALQALKKRFLKKG